MKKLTLSSQELMNSLGNKKPLLDTTPGERHDRTYAITYVSNELKYRLLGSALWCLSGAEGVEGSHGTRASIQVMKKTHPLEKEKTKARGRQRRKCRYTRYVWDRREDWKSCWTLGASGGGRGILKRIQALGREYLFYSFHINASINIKPLALLWPVMSILFELYFTSPLGAN